MGDILRRRGMMKAATGSGESWDFEWDYTKGAPDSNGFTKATSGSITTSMGNEGYVIKANNNNSWVRYELPTATMTTGVIEAVCRFDSFSGAENAQNFRFSASNGNNGIQTLENVGYFKLLNAETGTGWTSLGVSAETNRWYTIRLILGSTTSAVYIDGVLAVQNVANNTILYCQGNRFWQQRGGQTTVKSIKAKINRVE